MVSKKFILRTVFILATTIVFKVILLACYSHTLTANVICGMRNIIGTGSSSTDSIRIFLFQLNHLLSLPN
nr:MAG TPA: hypothetical protein [Caudoviricetes sp.]